MMLPVYFISHGSPDLMARSAPASDFLRELNLEPEKAKAVLMISAHWETAKASLTAAENPKQIYDFYGFPSELYDIKLPLRGSEAMAQHIAQHLHAHNIPVQLDTQRGLDHGAWMPIYLAQPDCRLPVLQLSIMPQKTAQQHYQLGQALKALRSQGVLVIGSGNITHNIRAALQGDKGDGRARAKAFDDWLHAAIISRDDRNVLDWQAQGPHAQWNHPTDDHILPLFVSLGAAQGEDARRIHHSYDYGVLSMGAYQFGAGG